MADKDLTVHLKADDKITPVAKKAAAELKKLEKPIELDADVSGVLSALDQVAAEAKATAAAADALASALGPELSAKADTGRIVGNLRDMGLTLDQVTANADQLGAKMRELADADVGGKMGSSLGTTRGKMDELSDSARGANSAMANMVGNATQDLGALGGVAGSAGVAIGQMGEYAADAAFGGEKLSTSLLSMGKVAGPIAAISLALKAAADVSARFADSSKRTKDAVDAVTDAVRRGESGIDAYADQLEELGKVITDNVRAQSQLENVVAELESHWYSTGAGVELFAKMMGVAKEETTDITPLLNKAGVELAQWMDLVKGGDTDAFAAALARTTLSADEQKNVLTGLTQAQENYATGQRNAAEMADFFDEGVTNATNALIVGYAPALDTATDAQQDLTQAIADGVDTAVAYAAAVDAMRDAHRSAADSAFAVRDAQRDFNDALAEWVELTGPESEATMQDLAAAMDETALSAGKVADSQVTLQAEQLKAAGTTQTAKNAQQVWNRSMIESARQAEGPLRDSIVNYIATVNNIPPEKVSEIIADPDYASIAAASVALDRAADTREADVRAEATNIGPTSTAIDLVASKKRTAFITVEMQKARSLVVPPGVSDTGFAATATATGPAIQAVPVGYAAPSYTIRVPQPAPTVNIYAGVVGNRFDVDRTVTKALRRHRRLNGERE